MSDPNRQVIDYRVVPHADGSWHYEWRYADAPDKWESDDNDKNKGKPSDPVTEQPLGGGGGGGGTQPAPPPTLQQRTKRAAAGAAIGMNDAAALLAGAAVLVAPVGLLVGAVSLGLWAGAALGVCSAGAWYAGNRYQQLANDPPRDDFHEIAAYKVAKLRLPTALETAPAIWRELAEESLHAARAIEAMTRSIERADGARIAIARGVGGNVAALHQRQHAAIRQNAASAASAMRALLGKRDAINVAWAALMRESEVARTLAPNTPDAIQAAFAPVRSQVESWLQHDLGLDTTEAKHIGAELATLLAHAPPERRTDVLLGDRWSTALQELTVTLDELSKTPTG